MQVKNKHRKAAVTFVYQTRIRRRIICGSAYSGFKPSLETPESSEPFEVDAGPSPIGACEMIRGHGLYILIRRW
jgi:hypothetical protein